MKADEKAGNEALSECGSVLNVNRFVGSVPADKEELNGCSLSSDILTSALNRMNNNEQQSNKKAAPRRYGFI